MNRIQTVNIFLNSKNRDTDFYNLITSGTPNYLAYCGWYLKKMISKTYKNSYFTISLKSLILPFSFDNISALNKTFVFTYLSVPYTISVEEGNPNITQLLTDIKNKILTAIPSILTNNLTFSYSSYTQTISIYNNTGNTMIFNFNDNFIGKMLGFTSNITILTGNTATSTININVNPLECIFVRSDNLSFASSYESIVEKSNISDIIAMVPVQVSSGNYITYNDSGAFETRLNDDKIDYIQLYLTSAVDDDHILSLNRDWSVHLQINEYKINDNGNVILDPIQINKVDELDEEKKKLKNKENELLEKLKKLELKKISKLNI